MEKTIMALLVEPEGLPREAAVLVTEDGLAAVLGAGPLEVRGVRRNARSGAVLTSVAMLCRREILIAARDIHPDAGGYPGPVILCGLDGGGALASLPPYLMEAYERACTSHGSGILRDGGLGTIGFSGRGQASMIGRWRFPLHFDAERGVRV